MLGEFFCARRTSNMRCKLILPREGGSSSDGGMIVFCLIGEAIGGGCCSRSSAEPSCSSQLRS